MSEETTTTTPASTDTLKVGMQVRGTVKQLELYGAFVDIGIGQDALLHISQLGKNVRNIEDVVKAGDEIDVFVLKIHKDTGRVALSMEKPPEFTWDQLSEGQTVTGKVVRIEKFGAFVDIGAERPGMVHVSELAEGYVKSPEDVVKVGDEVEARIIKINKKKRQIDLSMKAEEAPVEMVQEPDEEMPTAMEGQDDKPEKTSGKPGRKNKSNAEQEDILSRTLRDHRGS